MMTIQEAAELLKTKLNESFNPTWFSLGHNEVDTIFVYEHIRGLAKRRMESGEQFEGFKVIRKYVGKVVPG